jgi:hypothetical protein
MDPTVAAISLPWMASSVNTVTAKFLHKFKAGDVVDLRTTRGRHSGWEGPYKLTVYKIDPPTMGAKAAAYMEIDIGERKRFKRWLIAEDQQIIRTYIPKNKGKGNSE